MTPEELGGLMADFAREMDRVERLKTALALQPITDAAALAIDLIEQGRFQELKAMSMTFRKFVEAVESDEVDDDMLAAWRAFIAKNAEWTP